MKIPSILIATFAATATAIAVAAAAHEVGETVTPHFEQAIPNVPGKSVVAVIVDYAPGGASPSHMHARCLGETHDPVLVLTTSVRTGRVSAGVDRWGWWTAGDGPLLQRCVRKAWKWV
jgi:hypothetical protein